MEEAAARAAASFFQAGASGFASLAHGGGGLGEAAEAVAARASIAAWVR